MMYNMFTTSQRRQPGDKFLFKCVAHDDHSDSDGGSSSHSGGRPSSGHSEVSAWKVPTEICLSLTY